MLPRNVLAIRRALDSEVLTSLTSKTSTAMLLDFPPGAYTGMHEIELATKAMDHLRQESRMKLQAKEVVQSGLKFYYQHLREVLQQETLPEGETKVTILCTWDPQSQESAMVAHFEPLSTPKTQRCKIEIHGSPRQQATAKFSQWVRDRRVLEASMAKDSNEALLMDETTLDLYEGLSSNFFILDREKRSLVTAPLEHVLLGTIQKVVLSVCEKEKIPVEFRFPNLKHVDKWEGAFLTSTSRLLLPIKTVVMPDGSTKEFDENSTINLIRNGVIEECQKRVEPMFSDEIEQ
ncbi:hypothetical protein BGZ83_002885 [Gryganskiella cystojenkinii]|nr:hypothetical protein BGZ83_002885 [Gryganskiella cystojenkinii]